MFIYPTQDTNDKQIDTDICIIGGGAAGIAIALDFLDTNHKVILLAGGEWDETSYNRDLNNGVISPSGSHESLQENRRRQYGGATSVWGGRCIPFDEIDFENREWLPNCEWPITGSDVKPFYKKSLELCDAGNEDNFDARLVFPNTQKEIIKGIDNDNIFSWPLERWSPPVKFAIKYKNNLDNSQNIQVYINAHVKSINTLTEHPSKIDNVDVIVPSICNFKIKAKIFILAAGGIENPRLLLTSKSKLFPQGLGNNYDNVGRYYMSHFTGTYAIVNPTNRKNFVYNFERDKDNIYCRRRWWISPKAQKEYKIGNSIMFLHRSLNHEGHRDPIFSAVYLTKSFLDIIKQKKPILIIKKIREKKSELSDHIKIVATDGIKLIPEIFKLAKMRFANRRLPFILPSVNSKNFHLYFQTEHLPNRNSRISLSDEIDNIGVPYPTVHIDFHSSDIETIVKTHKIFVERFNETNSGSINFDEQELRNFISKKINNFNSSAHHLGTTRMSVNSDKGVVDQNCKIHEIENLYVAGGSVFATGGHANPTLLVLALSLRLSKHLKSELDLKLS